MERPNEREHRWFGMELINKHCKRNCKFWWQHITFPYDKRQFTATEYHNITNITNRLIFVHLASEIINFL